MKHTHGSAHLAGRARAARCDLRRSRHERRRLLRRRRVGRVLRVRRRRQRDPVRPAGAHGRRLARLPARRPPATRYGFRVHGPYDPTNGAPLQPGEAAARPVREGDRRERSTGTRRSSTTGSPIPTRATTTTARRFVPKSVVVNPFFDWGNDRRLRIPWNETVIYEVHVKGATHVTPTSSPSCAAPTPASPTRRSSST